MRVCIPCIHGLPRQQGVWQKGTAVYQHTARQVEFRVACVCRNVAQSQCTPTLHAVQGNDVGSRVRLSVCAAGKQVTDEHSVRVLRRMICT